MPSLPSDPEAARSRVVLRNVAGVRHHPPALKEGGLRLGGSGCCEVTSVASSLMARGCSMTRTAGEGRRCGSAD